VQASKKSAIQNVPVKRYRDDIGNFQNKTNKKNNDKVRQQSLNKKTEPYSWTFVLVAVAFFAMTLGAIYYFLSVMATE